MPCSGGPLKRGDKTAPGRGCSIRRTSSRRAAIRWSSWDALARGARASTGSYIDPDALEQDVQDAYDALIDAIDGPCLCGRPQRVCRCWSSRAHEIEANLDKYLDLDNDDFKTFRDKSWPVQKKCWL